MRCDKRRQIPAVSKILDALGHSDLPRPFVVEIVRRKLSQIRASSAVPEFESIVADVRRSLDEFRASRLQSVINGTGIVIHTNFGRAPLSSEAMHALNEIGAALFESRIRSCERRTRRARRLCRECARPAL